MSTYIITDDDRRRISDVLESYRPYLASEREQIVNLRGKLAEAVVVDAAHLSPDVVTMESTVCVMDMEDRGISTYTLVYPFDAKGGRLSLLSPLGTALLGLTRGKIFECRVGGRKWTLAVREITHQPERSLQRMRA